MMKAVTKLSNMARLYIRAGRIVHTRIDDLRVKGRKEDTIAFGCNRLCCSGLTDMLHFSYMVARPKKFGVPCGAE